MLATNRQLKFDYVTRNYELRGDMVYSKLTGEKVKFTRNSVSGRKAQSCHLTDGERLTRSTKYYSVNEHEAVWMLYHRKPIPEGNFHIHHIDGDALNNRPENLILLSARLHLLFHRLKDRSGKRYRFTTNPKNKSAPWIARVNLPTGQRLARCFRTETDAAAWVEKQYTPIINNFKKLGMWGEL
ncbi:HNH endonuclease [Escherichia coli]|nr:HNH endonuclease [Escherichia coli]